MTSLEGFATMLRSGKKLSPPNTQGEPPTEPTEDDTRKKSMEANDGNEINKDDAAKDSEENNLKQPTDGIGGLSGKAWTEGTTADDRKRTTTPFPNYSEDPEPLNPEASKKDHQAHLKVLRDYSSQMYTSYSRTSMRGEYLWNDFLNTFRPHTIRAWTKPSLHEWRDLLIKKGIHIKADRKRSPYEAIIDVLYREDHIGAGHNDSDENKARDEEDAREVGTKDDKRIQGSKEVDHVKNPKARTDEATDHEETELHKATETDGKDPDDDGSSSSSSEEDETKFPAKMASSKNNLAEGEKDRKPGKNDEKGWNKSAENDDDERSLGLSGMMKAFVGQTKFSGKYEEDLDDIIETFETYSNMCGLSKGQRRKVIPIMLNGNALSLFNQKSTCDQPYDEAIKLLKTWFSSREKQTRLLREWQGMRLTSAMQGNPEASEMSVYRTFVAKIMSVQKQLDACYHGDRQLRDQLMTSIDIPTVQDSLKDRVPRGAQQLVNRVANRLSEKNRTAGSTSAYIADARHNEYLNEMETEAHYTLGQRFGGEARRQVKEFGSRTFRGGRGRGKRSFGGRPRRPLPKWLVGVKGCMVCGKEGHRANQVHNEKEVKEAVRKLKEKQYTAMLTESDLAFVADMFEGNDEQDDAEEEQDENDAGGEEDEDDFAYVADSDLEDIQAHMTEVAFIHGHTIKANRRDMISAMYTGIAGENRRLFNGVKIDTAANRASIMSMDQYDAYCDTFGLRPAIKMESRTVRGIGGMKDGMGRATIQIPFPKLDLVVDIDFLLVAGTMPSLLCLKDMIMAGLDISIQDCTITHQGRTQCVALENFFMVYRWGPEDMTFVLYTEAELRTIHRVFGHPSVEATKKLLARASGGEMEATTRTYIEKISASCSICKMNASKPRRFKLTIGADGLCFNARVQVDTMFIRGKPVIHMVDQATHFCAAAFLRNQTSGEIWKAIESLWSLVYLGPPDYLLVDQGSNYVSKEFKGNAEANGVRIDEAPIETPGAIGTVERYHAPLRTAYERIRTEASTTTTDQDCMKMAVFAVNATVGPEGLCPILLVFGAMPRPARTSPTISQLDRARTIDAAMIDVEKEQSKRRIAFGLKHTGGPKGVETSANLRELPAGSPVIVYRHVANRWEGPHRFISVEGETVVIQTNRGRRIFRSNCIKPWVKPDWEKGDEMMTQETTTDTMAADVGKSPIGKVLTKESVRTVQFAESRKKELEGLVRNGTFITTERSQVPKGMRIFGARFIDELKSTGKATRQKSRLVAQNYRDTDARNIATKAPTIQRSSQRVMMSLAASLDNTTPFTRDITQAYVQSSTALEREVFIAPPKELGLPPDIVLKVVRPLYGIPESGLHWYLTYLDHHVGRLSMTRTKMDPCLLVRRNGRDIEGIIALQVDDSFSIGTQEFLREEQEASKRFVSKPRRKLSGDPTTFNGVTIKRTPEGTITTNQSDKISKLQLPKDQAEFNSQRARAQYIGVCTRPDVCANVQLVAPGSEETTPDEHKILKKTIEHLHKTSGQCLTFKRLDMRSVQLTVITDASFANARKLRSQLGFVILMSDDNGTSNVIHYGSSRCKRVTRSILAAEVHALVYGYDQAFVIRDMLTEILGRDIPLEAYVDSRSVFDIIAKDGNTIEKRLQIDIYALRQSYTNGELDRIGWIPGAANPADALTKTNNCKSTALSALIATNRISLAPIGWASVAKENGEHTRNARNEYQPTGEKEGKGEDFDHAVKIEQQGDRLGTEGEPRAQ